jgi:hypothetical protein
MPEVYGQVTLSWNANSEADLQGYRILYGRAPGVAEFIYPTSGVIAPSPSPSVTLGDGVLEAYGTVYFRVVAVDTSENVSSPSSEVNIAVAPKLFPLIWP